MEKAVAFAERESDLVRMTILRMEDGRLYARKRLPDDHINPTYQEGEYNDIWRHVKSDGLYIRHDRVIDIETDIECYDYSSCQDGRLWLRSIKEWHEVIDGRTRFEKIETDRNDR